MRIVFLDLTTPKPYDSKSLENEPLGGTEATVIRIAEALAASGIDTIVAQHNRIGLEPSEGKAAYVSIEALDAMHTRPDAVVCLRTPKGLPWARNKWGDTKLFLWCHDFNVQELVQDFPIIADTRAKILGVSDCHKTVIMDALLTQVKETGNVTVDFIYNPVSDELIPNDTVRRQRKLVFFSSPHKGLDRTLDEFRNLRRQMPMLTLYVANPGYFNVRFRDADIPGVIVLGKLPHHKVMQHVREAFCVFHCNTEFPETFGLVYAEANAVGTPCIAHDMAAVPEVLGRDSDQLIDARVEGQAVDRFLRWQREGAPLVFCRPEFRTSAVIKKWMEVVNGA